MLRIQKNDADTLPHLPRADLKPDTRWFYCMFFPLSSALATLQKQKGDVAFPATGLLYFLNSFQPLTIVYRTAGLRHHRWGRLKHIK